MVILREISREKNSELLVCGLVSYFMTPVIGWLALSDEQISSQDDHFPDPKFPIKKSQLLGVKHLPVKVMIVIESKRMPFKRVIYPINTHY